MTESLVHASTMRLRGLSGSAFSVAVGLPAGSSCRSSVALGAGVVAACTGVGGIVADGDVVEIETSCAGSIPSRESAIAAKSSWSSKISVGVGVPSHMVP